MSRENVETVRLWIEAWNQRDIERMLGSFHPDIEWYTSGVFPGLDPLYVGHGGFRRFWLEFVDPWESFVVSLEEQRECGEKILSLGWFEGEGRDDLQVRRPAAAVWTFRDRLGVRVHNYSDWAQALKAVGAS